MGWWIALGVVVALVVLYLLASVKVVNEYERGVVFLFGRVRAVREPGLHFVPAVAERLVRVSLQTTTIDIPARELITSDSVTVQVNAVAWYRVLDPVKALVEVRDVLLPESMRRAMAREAEAERERRAKVVSARGELEAATALNEAAALLEQHHSAIRLRELATLLEISAEKNSTIIFPLPVELLRLADAATDLLGSRPAAAARDGSPAAEPHRAGNGAAAEPLTAVPS